MIKPDQDSFLIYWPKIRDLPIPQPTTDIVYLTEADFKATFEGVPKELTQQVADHIKGHFNLPIFLRTDESSAKHDWENTCYYDGTKPLEEHLFKAVLPRFAARFAHHLVPVHEPAVERPLPRGLDIARAKRLHHQVKGGLRTALFDIGRAGTILYGGARCQKREDRPHSYDQQGLSHFRPPRKKFLALISDTGIGLKWPEI